jgi:hypothetical protein
VGDSVDGIVGDTVDGMLGDFVDVVVMGVHTLQ